MADDKFFKQRFRKEIESMQISLQAGIARAKTSLTEFVRKQTVAGVSKAELRRLLETDLKQGGRIFGEFRNTVKATTTGTVGRLSTSAYLSEFGIDIKYTWVAALVNTCVDCMPRHGKVKTYDQWESQGLPRTGWSVCKENCQCVIIPEEAAKERTELSKPLDRKGAQALRAEKKKKFNPTGV